MSPWLALPLFVVSLVVTLGAAALFARRLDRLGARLGFPEALVGLLTALAADGPEITSALVALAKGAHAVSVGVLVGSNLFNLAAMIGVSALLAGSVSLAREVLFLEGLVGAAATLVAAAVLLQWLGPVAAMILDACVLVPYLALLVYGPRLPGRSPGHGRLIDRLQRALEQRERPERAVASPDPTRHLLGLIALDVTLIVTGSAGMVQASVALADHWHIAQALLGVLILAPLTSIPNAFTGVRLGLVRRGSALVGETFNSNTINLTAGVVLPSLFVSLAALSDAGRAAIWWLIATTALTTLLLAPRAGMRRPGALLRLAAYAGFVAYQLAAT